MATLGHHLMMAVMVATLLVTLGSAVAAVEAAVAETKEPFLPVAVPTIV